MQLELRIRSTKRRNPAMSGEGRMPEMRQPGACTQTGWGAKAIVGPVKRKSRQELILKALRIRLENKKRA